MTSTGQLLVLHGSLLDVWDLPNGDLLGRFELLGPQKGSFACD